MKKLKIYILYIYLHINVLNDQLVILKVLHNCMNLLITGTLKRSKVILTKSDKQVFREYKKDICVGSLDVFQKRVYWIYTFYD